MAQTIHGSGIDPVHPQLQRVANAGNGLGVILRSPAKGPTATANRPRAKPHRGQSKLGSPQSPSRQSRYHQSHPMSGRSFTHGPSRHAGSYTHGTEDVG